MQQQKAAKRRRRRLVLGVLAVGLTAAGGGRFVYRIWPLLVARLQVYYYTGVPVPVSVTWLELTDQEDEFEKTYRVRYQASRDHIERIIANPPDLANGQWERDGRKLRATASLGATWDPYVSTTIGLVVDEERLVVQPGELLHGVACRYRHQHRVVADSHQYAAITKSLAESAGSSCQLCERLPVQAVR